MFGLMEYTTMVLPGPLLEEEDELLSVGTQSDHVTTQDFIKFWGKFFAFVLLEMIDFSQRFKTFESIWKLY
jgi:hypothetical protein